MQGSPAQSLPLPKIYGGPRKSFIRDPGLSSPIPSLTKNLWRPQKKTIKRDAGLSSPIPSPTQEKASGKTKIYGGPKKTTL